MRIAYVCADRGVPVFGQKGCSVHVQEMVRAFINQGIKVDLLASRFDGACPSDLSLVATHILPRITKQADEGFSLMVKSLNIQIQEDLKHLGPIDLIYERYSLWSYGAMDFARQQGIPGVLEVNAPLVLEEQLHRHLSDEKFALECEEMVFQSASLIVGVSKEVCGYVDSKLSGRIQKTLVVPNGINRQRFEEVQSLKRSWQKQQTITIGFLGTLKVWHGVDYLLQAFAVLIRRYGHLRLLIVGDGPQKDQIVSQINELGIVNYVELTGAVSPEEVAYYLSRMDIAVAPYPALDHFYFSPLKVYEYMASGLAVVVSRIGQLQDLIVDRENGIFFRPGDVQSLVDAITLLIENPELSKQLGINAQKKMFDECTWDLCAGKILTAACSVHSGETEYVHEK